MNKDLEHLRLLSIFHYVVGGIIALVACFPIIHLAMGIFFLSMPIPNQPHSASEQNPEFVFRLVGILFVIIPTLIILLGWTLAICTVVAGRNLAQHKNYTFCLVIAGFLCFFMPFGTVLGVFTLIVLLRDSVKPLFNRSDAANINSLGNPPLNWK